MIVKSRQAWIDQAEECYKAMNECGAINLNDFHSKDPDSFSRLIESLNALGVEIAPDLIEKARLRPVEELLGLP